MNLLRCAVHKKRSYLAGLNVQELSSEKAIVGLVKTRTTHNLSLLNVYLCGVVVLHVLLTFPLKVEKLSEILNQQLALLSFVR